MAISSAFLEDLIYTLRKDHVAILPLREALLRLEQRDMRPFVALTFDDGYRDVYEEVFPVALKLDAPVTSFVTTGLVDRTAPMWWHALESAIYAAEVFAWNGSSFDIHRTSEKRTLYAAIDRQFRSLDCGGQRDLLRSLAFENESLDLTLSYDAAVTWDMVARMARSGLVEIGCHTVDHPVLSHLNDAALAAQIRGSRERVKAATGIDASFLAYPFGQMNEVGTRAAAHAEDAGFDAAFSTQAALITPSHLGQRWFLPRLMLSSKAQSSRIVAAYRTGIPFKLRRFREDASQRLAS